MTSMHSHAPAEAGAEADPSALRAAGWRRGAAATVAALLVWAPLAASAENDAGVLAKDGGLGAGAAVASLLYAPVKLVYATGGLIVGGLAWAFSGGDSEVAKVVFAPSLRGDYVVTRRHLTGKQRLEFFGRGDPMSGQTVSSGDVAAAPTEWTADW